MHEVDMVVFKNIGGYSNVDDYWGVGHRPPIKDKVQNWKKVTGIGNGMVAERNLKVLTTRDY